MALYLGDKIIAAKTALPQDIGAGKSTVTIVRYDEQGEQYGIDLDKFWVYKLTQQEYNDLEVQGLIDDNALYLVEDSGESGGNGGSNFSPIYVSSENFEINTTFLGQTVQTLENQNLEVTFSNNPDFPIGSEFAFLKYGFSATSELVLNAINGAQFAVTGEAQYCTEVRIIDAFGMAAVKYIGGTPEAPIFLVTGNVEVIA